jgi:hypothetical protein
MIRSEEAEAESKKMRVKQKECKTMSNSGNRHFLWYKACKAQGTDEREQETYKFHIQKYTSIKQAGGGADERTNEWTSSRRQWIGVG